jgi:hypothetical protein
LSDTPRTDAAKFSACVDESDATYDEVVFAEDMAKIEHELTAALKEKERVMNVHKALMAEADRRLDDALKENAELRHDIARHVAIAAELATEAMKK